MHHKTYNIHIFVMNKLRFLLLLIALVAAIGVSAKKKYPIIKFEQTTIDLGTFSTDNAVRKCTFTFRNVGKAKLMINYVHTSCGCTVADYPKDFISPGGVGQITVTYDGRGKMPGRFKKAIQIYSNCKDDYMRLFITGKMSATATSD